MRIKIINHKSGDLLPIIVDDDGLPIPSPNEFILSRRNLSANTLLRNLRELAVFYKWLKINQIDLELPFLLKSKNLFTEAEFKGGMIEFLRKDMVEVGTVVSPETFNNRLATVRQYLVWRIDVSLSQLSFTDKQYELLETVKKRLLNWIDNSFINASKASGVLLKSLTDKEVEFLLQCLNPVISDSFGYFEPLKYRNFVIVMLMLNCGLRPGELLSLRVEDIQIGAISSVTVRRRPLDPMDKRNPRPSIKRMGRILPLEGNNFLRILDKYIMEKREILQERSNRDTDYLVLSDEGEPLSHSSLTLFFTRLRKAYPDSLPSILTPKSLRHTFSMRLERVLRESGYEEERRRQALALLRGDTSLESQTVYIAQEIEENARKALALYQKKIIGDSYEYQCNQSTRKNNS
ncbi:MAG: phage integrase family protein [Erysipelotrichia bacterium]|nr:phage integrase family protein [Erysipelotrichia bacterium]